MKRKPKTTRPATVRIGTEDQQPSREYWEAEAKLAIRSIAEIGDENRQLRATVANQIQLIKELRDDNSREFAAGGQWVAEKAIYLSEQWYGLTSKIVGDRADLEPEVKRAMRAVRFFAEAAAKLLGTKAADSEPNSSGKTAANP